MSMYTVADCDHVQEYYTHYNGERPYRVVVASDNVLIYDRTIDTTDDTTDDTTVDTTNDNPFEMINSSYVWIGESPLTEMTQISGAHDDRFLGNSILIEVKSSDSLIHVKQNKVSKHRPLYEDTHEIRDRECHVRETTSNAKNQTNGRCCAVTSLQISNKHTQLPKRSPLYVFVGHCIFKFFAHSRIVEYVSEVGNNDVPYPYAIDADGNYYLMTEEVILREVSSDYRRRPYEYYYANRRRYSDLVNIKHLIAGHDRQREVYSLNFYVDPKKHYHRDWMTNMHAVRNSDNHIYPISEDDYVNLMDRIAIKFGYERIHRV